MYIPWTENETNKTDIHFFLRVIDQGKRISDA